MHVPLIFVEIIEKRISECPYSSASKYFLGLMIYDCWSRRPHRAQHMAQPGKERDAALEKIAEMFDKQEQRSSDPGRFDHFVGRIVREEMAKAGVTLRRSQLGDVWCSAELVRRCGAKPQRISCG